MCRIARIKFPNGIYHITSRSTSDIKLFKNCKDKDKFLLILKKYKFIFKFKIFAYCLMNTHFHLLIHSNKCDISHIMKCINQSYAQYYNHKYNRIGHVFADRFTSSIAKKDLDVILMSSYIHNNPKDIYKYKNNVETYPYSSFSIYLGKSSNSLNLVDNKILLSYFGKDIILSKIRYHNFVKQRLIDKSPKINIKFTHTIKNFFKTDIINSSFNHKKIHSHAILNYICSKIKEDTSYNTISNKKSYNYRAFYIFLIRCFSNNYISDNYNSILNLKSFSSLCTKGYTLLLNSHYFSQLFKTFCEKYSLNYAYDPYF